MTIKIRSLALLLLSSAAFVACQNGGHTVAIEPEKSASTYMVDDSGVAAQGFDVVAYHSLSRAVKGSPMHAAEHGGARWHFSSDTTKKAFEAHPERYVPAYGGYCAFGVAANQAAVPPNPATFTVQDGRLLLFFNGDYQGQHVDTSKMWSEDRDALLVEADRNWPTVAAK